MYDYLLGGKDHYEADRQLVKAVEQMVPNIEQFARVNRQFMMRAVRWCATTGGVTQFLDCGSGLPTAQNVHQVAARYQGEAKVVYVDHDPIVAAHGRAILSENDRTHFVQADFREPEALLANPTVRTELDWSKPICLVHGFTLHHIDNPVDVMATLVAALPPGSFVVLSHVHRPDGSAEHANLVDRIHERAREGGLHVWFRSRAEIEALFAGLEVMEPGVVRLVDWWPAGPQELVEPWDQLSLGGLGRKPE
ncbi:S-adenosyl methyltransferase [Tamaricihabitans halophyticus]|uniref:S-adenosyl methyltransferase n=2 Tax=Tamaricihabitans halophyticus TaxID=1262583 RepID=A0A4R2QG04_9PSEU|nr:S-adenosyl methyltransferase [Tamaricihabitans halophyticus]